MPKEMIRSACSMKQNKIWREYPTFLRAMQDNWFTSWHTPLPQIPCSSSTFLARIYCHTYGMNCRHPTHYLVQLLQQYFGRHVYFASDPSVTNLSYVRMLDTQRFVFVVLQCIIIPLLQISIPSFICGIWIQSFSTDSLLCRYILLTVSSLELIDFNVIERRRCLCVL